MADSNIGALPLAPNLADDSLLVMEQQGQAMRVTGQQLKGYAKEGVELKFQDYLDEAKEAADSAAGAVSAVTDMTVEAHASDTATVTKSTRAGKVNLSFGLPQGERGVPGPAGETGPRGPQGVPGNGLTILGHYDAEAELRAAVTAPEVGEAYSVGTELPYDTYIFDGVILDWKNYGPLSGGGGIVPKNVVTAEGGAAIEIPASFGDAPHVITITDEEEPPLTAADVEYDNTATGMAAGTVQEAVDELFTCVSDGKALIASAVTDKGVPTPQDATFAKLAESIGQISTGADTQDATATPGDILAPKTAYTKSGKVEGIIPSLPAQTITPGTADKTLANGQYLAGTQTIKGDPNLTSGNIKKGVSLFGVAGALETSFAATLTVKADVGAVVTASCGDMSLEALSTTGTVVLELPIEGTWKVTAVRGMAQYNTVTLEVSSRYSAELTAEVHIEYFGTVTPLSAKRSHPAAASIGNHALFGGGSAYSGYFSAGVDSYDNNLVHETPTILEKHRQKLSAASTKSHALFAGGDASTANAIGLDVVDAYDENLTRSNPDPLSTGRYDCGASSIGGCALFGGGISSYLEDGSYSYAESVEAYDEDLTKTIAALPFAEPMAAIATANENYAIFYGRSSNNAYAYDKNLTRTILPKGPTYGANAAARAGNYATFVRGGTAFAYDLFLTRSELEAPIWSPGLLNGAGVTLREFALFGEANSKGAFTLETYDPYLVHTIVLGLSGNLKSDAAAAAAGDYALFGPGDSELGTVHAFKYV